MDSAKSKSSFRFLPVPKDFKFIQFIMNKLQVCAFVRWWKLSLEMLSQCANSSFRTIIFWSLCGQAESAENLCWSFTELLNQNLVLKDLPLLHNLCSSAFWYMPVKGVFDTNLWLLWSGLPAVNSRHYSVSTCDSAVHRKSSVFEKEVKGSCIFQSSPVEKAECKWIWKYCVFLISPWQQQRHFFLLVISVMHFHSSARGDTAWTMVTGHVILCKYLHLCMLVWSLSGNCCSSLILFGENCWGFTASSGQSRSHMLPVYVGQGCVFANTKYFFQICSLIPFVSDLMVVMIGVNLVLLAARIQMRKKRKKSQQPG